MFERYKPSDNKLYQVIDNDGKVIIKDWKARLSSTEVVSSYKDMLFERTADFMAVSYQRQGRMFTYPPNFGQEAIHIAAGKVIQKEDWLIPAFRELGAWLAKGVTLREVFHYFKGSEMGSHYANAHRVLPTSVPIASQLLHAVGIAYAMKYKGESSVAFGFVGDGGTSEGDFHEALNFAAVWEAPVVFIVQNNQFAISVPLKMQTRSINLAVKGVAYNIPSVMVDGNDFFAMYDAIHYAREQAASGKCPFLIEAVTYRRGAHTTSDDPTKYRTKEEETSWENKDPLKRLKAYLVKNDLYDLDEESLVDEFKKKIDTEFEAAENAAPYELREVFEYMYEDMPDELKRQKNMYENYQKWIPASAGMTGGVNSHSTGTNGGVQ